MKRLTWLALVLLCTACGGTPGASDAADAHVPGEDATTDMDGGAPPQRDGGDGDADESCNGCLAPTGDCLAGDSNPACGQGGAACSACTGIELCADGECLAPPACSPLNCDGCCDGDTCVEGTSTDACGSSGAVCASCGGDATCDDASGRRQCVMHCGPDNCGGCCDVTGRCVTETDASRCGEGGGACAACGTGETCGSGACVTEACAATCDGCCRPDGTCDEGVLDETCGWAGEACAVCAAGYDCDQGCVPFVGPESCRGCYQDGVCVEGTANDACGENGRACHDCGELDLQCASTLDGVFCGVDPEAHYDVYVLSADVGTDGVTWDAFGGLPDLYVEGYWHYPRSGATDEHDVTRTPTIDDTLFGDWGHLLLFSDVTAAHLSNLEISVYDEDPLDDDLVRVCFIHFDDDHARLSQRLLVNEEVYDCIDNDGLPVDQALRLQFVRR
jgi:hypothetical protein